MYIIPGLIIHSCVMYTGNHLSRIKRDKKNLVSGGQHDNDSGLLPPLNYSLENEAYIREDQDSDALNSSHVICSAENMPADCGTSTRKDDSNATDKPNELSNKSPETTNCPPVSYQPSKDTKVQIKTSVIDTESNQRKPMEKMEDIKKHVSRFDNDDRWPTSFWTQFCVLTHRTFKQSLPTILSKLNLVQVGFASGMSEIESNALF